MKIKQSTFYTFRILRNLDKEKDRVLTSKEIGEIEGLSPGVILKLLRVMGQGGIVCAHQGRGDKGGGGFSLTKSIDEITVLEVLKTMEGVDICTNLDAVSRKKETQMFRTFNQLNEELEELLSKYTVRDLFESDAAGSLLDTG